MKKITEQFILKATDMFEYYLRLYQSGMLQGRRSQITILWMRQNGYEGKRFRPERDRVRLEVKEKLAI